MTRRAWCYKCMKRRADLLELDDGVIEPQTCWKCQQDRERSVNRWLERSPRRANVDGVDVEDYMTDEAYYKHHCFFSDAVDRKEAYRRWKELGNG